jgi:hypothetical protein
MIFFLNFMSEINEMYLGSKKTTCITKKLNGYKQQDIKNKIYSEYHFVTTDLVLEKLIVCKMKCLYCQQSMLLHYNAKDKLQWTLDRIDNTMGHNKDNIVISCLECNLKRRNRSVEKYLFTKQLKIVKI